jgi:hypothetical protein
VSAFVLAAVVAALTGLGAIRPAGAACLPPELSVTVPTAPAGGTVVVTGVAFADAGADHTLSMPVTLPADPAGVASRP